MAIYSVGTFRKSAFVVVLVASLSVLSAAAQFQNPIQAAKDAYNKSKQQQQQQNKPQQAAPQGQATQSTNAPLQSSSTAPSSPAENGDCCSPEALKKIAASVGFVDIVGIKLGMTPEQATAAIKAYKSTFKIEVLNTRLFHPGSEQFLRVPRYISAYEPNSPKGYEWITVEFTQRPSPPLVSQIQRYVQFPSGQPVMASTLLESLRKKYGQYNFSQNGPLAWIYDLSGKLPARVGNTGPCTDIDGLNGGLPRGSGEPGEYGQISLDTARPETLPRGINSPACVPYVAFVARGVGEETAPNSQLVMLTTTLQSGALVYNSGRATYNWLKGEADAKAKELEDAAKARKGPKL
jgi:hypothetical protein